MSKASQARDKTLSSFDRDAYAAQRKARSTAPAPLVSTISIVEDAKLAVEANASATARERSADAGRRGAFGNKNISNDERMQKHVRRYAVERIATLTNEGKLPLIPAKKKQDENQETQIQP